MRSWGWSSRDGISGLMGRNSREPVHSPSVDRSSLQAQKRALARFWHLDLGLPSLQDGEKTSVCSLSHPVYILSWRPELTHSLCLQRAQSRGGRYTWDFSKNWGRSMHEVLMQGTTEDLPTSLRSNTWWGEENVPTCFSDLLGVKNGWWQSQNTVRDIVCVRVCVFI